MPVSLALPVFSSGKSADMLEQGDAHRSFDAPIIAVGSGARNGDAAHLGRLIIGFISMPYRHRLAKIWQLKRRAWAGLRFPTWRFQWPVTRNRMRLTIGIELAQLPQRSGTVAKHADLRRLLVGTF